MRDTNGHPTTRRARRKLLTPLAILMLVANAAPFVAPAAAATQTKATSISMSGGLATDIKWNIEGGCDDCVPDDLAAIAYSDDASYVAKVEAQIHVTQMTWYSQAAIDVSFDDQLLRQGQTVNLNDKLAVTGGTMTATGTISGSMFIERDGTTNVEDFGSFSAPLNLSWPCAVPLPGESPRPCASGNADTQVFSLQDHRRRCGGRPPDAQGRRLAHGKCLDEWRRLERPAGRRRRRSCRLANVTWLGSSPSTTTDSRALYLHGTGRERRHIPIHRAARRRGRGPEPGLDLQAPRQRPHRSCYWSRHRRSRRDVQNGAATPPCPSEWASPAATATR